MDGKVGEKESGGAGLSIKVTWGLRGSGRARAGGRARRACSRGSWGLEFAKNPATCSLSPFMEILRSP